MNKSVLSFYLWAYDNDENVNHILKEMRKHYPDSDLVVSSDNGFDFSEICTEHNACHYIHGKESHGYPTNDGRHGWSAAAASIWFSRVYEACMNITTDYVMLMEEDILVKERFKFPAKDIVMIPNIKNPISPSGMNWVKERGGSTSYPYYSAGGGTIINRKKFIQAYDNHMADLLANYDDLYEKSFSEGVIGWGWNDSLMCVLMYADNATMSTELPILETGNENDPAPIIHKFKKFYKNQITKELVLALWDRDFSWTSQVAHDVKITKYNKNSDTAKQDEIFLSPNVGRDVHTFFYHIVNNYDNLADYTFFSQDYKEDHVSAYQHIINGSVDFLPRYAIQDLVGCWFFNDNPYHNRIFDCDKKGYPDHPELPIEEIWDMLFTSSMPDVIQFTPAGHFCVTRQHIQEIPKERFEKVLHILETHEMAPWCIERLEPYIFNKHIN